MAAPVGPHGPADFPDGAFPFFFGHPHEVQGSRTPPPPPSAGVARRGPHRRQRGEERREGSARKKSGGDRGAGGERDAPRDRRRRCRRGGGSVQRQPAEAAVQAANAPAGEGVIVIAICDGRQGSVVRRRDGGSVRGDAAAGVGRSNSGDGGGFRRSNGGHGGGFRRSNTKNVGEVLSQFRDP